MQKFFTMLANKPRLTNFPYQVSCVSFWQLGDADTRCVMEWDTKLSFAIRSDPAGRSINQQINGVSHVLGPCHVVIKRPGNRYFGLNTAGCTSLTLDYPTGQCPSLLAALGLKPEELCWSFQSTGELDALIRELIELAQLAITRGGCDRIDIIAYQLLTELAVRRRDDVGRHAGANELMQITSYLQTHCREEIDFDRLAVQFGMSRSTLFRKWSRLFQVSPARYLQELRLQEARRLLVETGDRVGDIARMVGFDNVSYFIQAFRHFYGITPTEFRGSEKFLPGDTSMRRAGRGRRGDELA